MAPPIVISKPYLPDRRRLARYIDRVYETARLTNRGPLVRELEDRLTEYLGVDRLMLMANGTLALQVAYRVLGIEGSALTTPFSFVATTSSLAWDHIDPVFVDIDPVTLNMDPNLAGTAIHGGVSAVVPVHVYGNPVDPAIDRLGADRDLKVVHDAAHAFGVRQGGQSVLTRGDASILSLHATKLFHTAEGGAVVFADAAAHEEAAAIINFGILGEDTIGPLGLNAKMNELEAAMGLAVLDEIDRIVEMRRIADERYLAGLGDAVRYPSRSGDATPNHAYRPIVLETEAEAVAVRDALGQVGAQARRYFRPSLDRLPYVEGPGMPHSIHAADTVLCLPLYAGLESTDIDLVVGTVLRVLTAVRSGPTDEGVTP